MAHLEHPGKALINVQFRTLERHVIDVLIRKVFTDNYTIDLTRQFAIETIRKKKAEKAIELLFWIFYSRFRFYYIWDMIRSKDPNAHNDKFFKAYENAVKKLNLHPNATKSWKNLFINLFNQFNLTVHEYDYRFLTLFMSKKQADLDGENSIQMWNTFLRYYKTKGNVQHYINVLRQDKLNDVDIVKLARDNSVDDLITAFNFEVGKVGVEPSDPMLQTIDCINGLMTIIFFMYSEPKVHSVSYRFRLRIVPLNVNLAPSLPLRHDPEMDFSNLIVGGEKEVAAYFGKNIGHVLNSQLGGFLHGYHKDLTSKSKSDLDLLVRQTLLFYAYIDPLVFMRYKSVFPRERIYGKNKFKSKEEIEKMKLDSINDILKEYVGKDNIENVKSIYSGLRDFIKSIFVDRFLVDDVLKKILPYRNLANSFIETENYPIRVHQQLIKRIDRHFKTGDDDAKEDDMYANETDQDNINNASAILTEFVNVTKFNNDNYKVALSGGKSLPSRWGELPQTKESVTVINLQKRVVNLETQLSNAQRNLDNCLKRLKKCKQDFQQQKNTFDLNMAKTEERCDQMVKKEVTEELTQSQKQAIVAMKFVNDGSAMIRLFNELGYLLIPVINMVLSYKKYVNKDSMSFDGYEVVLDTAELFGKYVGQEISKNVLKIHSTEEKFKDLEKKVLKKAGLSKSVKAFTGELDTNVEFNLKGYNVKKAFKEVANNLEKVVRTLINRLQKKLEIYIKGKSHPYNLSQTVVVGKVLQKIQCDVEDIMDWIHKKDSSLPSTLKGFNRYVSQCYKCEKDQLGCIRGELNVQTKFSMKEDVSNKLNTSGTGNQKFENYIDTFIGMLKDFYGYIDVSPTIQDLEDLKYTGFNTPKNQQKLKMIAWKFANFDIGKITEQMITLKDRLKDGKSISKFNRFGTLGDDWMVDEGQKITNIEGLKKKGRQLKSHLDELFDKVIRPHGYPGVLTFKEFRNFDFKNNSLHFTKSTQLNTYDVFVLTQQMVELINSKDMVKKFRENIEIDTKLTYKSIGHILKNSFKQLPSFDVNTTDYSHLLSMVNQTEFLEISLLFAKLNLYDSVVPENQRLLKQEWFWNIKALIDGLSEANAENVLKTMSEELIDEYIPQTTGNIRHKMKEFCLHILTTLAVNETTLQHHQRTGSTMSFKEHRYKSTLLKWVMKYCLVYHYYLIDHDGMPLTGDSEEGNILSVLFPKIKVSTSCRRCMTMHNVPPKGISTNFGTRGIMVRLTTGQAARIYRLLGSIGIHRILWPIRDELQHKDFNFLFSESLTLKKDTLPMLKFSDRQHIGALMIRITKSVNIILEHKNAKGSYFMKAIKSIKNWIYKFWIKPNYLDLDDKKAIKEEYVHKPSARKVSGVNLIGSVKGHLKPLIINLTEVIKIVSSVYDKKRGSAEYWITWFNLFYDGYFKSEFSERPDNPAFVLAKLRGEEIDSEGFNQVLFEERMKAYISESQFTYIAKRLPVLPITVALSYISSALDHDDNIAEDNSPKELTASAFNVFVRIVIAMFGTQSYIDESLLVDNVPFFTNLPIMSNTKYKFGGNAAGDVRMLKRLIKTYKKRGGKDQYLLKYI